MPRSACAAATTAQTGVERTVGKGTLTSQESPSPVRLPWLRLLRSAGGSPGGGHGHGANTRTHIPGSSPFPERSPEGTHLQDDGKLLGWVPVLHAHREPHLERGQLLGEERTVLWDRQGR